MKKLLNCNGQKKILSCFLEKKRQGKHKIKKKMAHPTDSFDPECVCDLLRLVAFCKAKVTDTTLYPVVLNLSSITSKDSGIESLKGKDMSSVR